MKFRKVISLCLVMVMLISTVAVSASATVLSKDFSEDNDVIQEKINSMTLREKVGQMFMIMPRSLTEEGKAVTELTDEMRETYKDYPAGGFILFYYAISNPEQLVTFTADLHNIDSDPSMQSLISIDEEGGTVKGSVKRIAGHPGFENDPDIKQFESMQAIGETGDPANAYEVGSVIGKYLEKYGIDIDFAPVADVNTNPESSIGVRSFGSDPNLVASMVEQELKGLADRGVEGCVKHFPGLGGTSADTHEGYAETQKTWDEMKQCEIIPFEAGIEAGSNLVMVGHISAPNVTGSSIPASLSKTFVTDKLRNEMGYDGVIITDGLEMGAINEQYTSAEAAIEAIKAGEDILLLPLNYKEAFDGVVAAVNSGEISESRIDESVYRILKLKDYKPTDKNGWVETHGKWQYYEDGKFVTGWRNNISGWEGQWFYFNASGIMQTGWKQINNVWYYLNPNNGVMQTGWLFEGNNWYYLDSSGAMQTGWRSDIAGWQGKWFYFGGNGAMLTGWQQLDWSGGKDWFCFNTPTGWMYTNCTTPDGYQVDANGRWIR